MVTGYLLEQFVLANKAHIPALPQAARRTRAIRDDTNQEPHVSVIVILASSPSPSSHSCASQFLGVGRGLHSP